MSIQLTVDVHAHLLVPAIEQTVAGRPGHAEAVALDRRRNGPASLAVSGRMIGERMPRLVDVGRRLADMDAAGVDVQVVSPSPSHYHPWADPETADEVVALAATAIGTVVSAAPDRLVGLGLAPLQHPERMVQALELAVGRGFAGVEISSHAPLADGGTIELSNPRLEAFWARATELDAVVFVHPFGCSLDERLDQWYLTNVVGQPVENAVAVSHVIFGGVLDRHPGLRLIISHGGGYLPAFVGRMDHGWLEREDIRSCRDRPSSYLSRIWFDSLVHDPRSLRVLVDQVGAGQVLLGSDYPFDMGVDDPVARLLAAGLDDDAVAAIRGGNAAALGLSPTARIPVSAELISGPTSKEYL